MNIMGCLLLDRLRHKLLDMKLRHKVMTPAEKLSTYLAVYWKLGTFKYLCNTLFKESDGERIAYKKLEGIFQGCSASGKLRDPVLKERFDVTEGISDYQIADRILLLKLVMDDLSLPQIERALKKLPPLELPSSHSTPGEVVEFFKRLSEGDCHERPMRS